jgi:hypothetical protein
MCMLLDAPLTPRTAEIVLQLARKNLLDTPFLAEYISTQMDVRIPKRDVEAKQRCARLVSA